MIELNITYLLLNKVFYTILILGKTSVKAFTKKQKKELNREQRRNQAMQIRQNKRDEILSKKRAIGGASNAPFLGMYNYPT